MGNLIEKPIETEFDVTLTCKHLTLLSRNRQTEVAKLFCTKIGLIVDEAPEGWKEQLAFVLRAKDTCKTVGYVIVENERHGEVPAGLVSDLWDYMRLDGVENGIIFSKRPFSVEAKDAAIGRQIELIDARNLYDNILILSEDDIADIEKLSHEIRYTAPMCPRCKSVMDKANNGIGTYWKCHNYPRCRQTFMS